MKIFLSDQKIRSNLSQFRINMFFLYALDAYNSDFFKILFELGFKYDDAIKELKESIPKNSFKHLLFEIVYLGSLECLKYYLDNHNYDINIRDEIGNTALIYACYTGYYECAKILLDHDANYNLINNDGHNAFQLALECKTMNDKARNEKYNSSRDYFLAYEKANKCVELLQNKMFISKL